MIRKLLIVAASALVLAIVSLGIGWIVGGPAIMERINKEGGIVINVDDDDNAPKATRTLPFNANQLMVIDAPVELEFTRGTDSRITIEGPAKLVDMLKIENGRLFLDHQGVTVRHGGLHLTISAPELPPIEVRSAGDLTLVDVQQKLLKLTLAGAANVEGSGKVEMLEVDASGAGNLDFERLSATNGKVTIAGIGNADLRVSGTLDANISGAGNVTLHEKPQNLTSHVSGIGSVDEAY